MLLPKPVKVCSLALQLKVSMWRVTDWAACKLSEYCKMPAGACTPTGKQSSRFMYGCTTVRHGHSKDTHLERLSLEAVASAGFDLLLENQLLLEGVPEGASKVPQMSRQDATGSWCRRASCSSKKLIYTFAIIIIILTVKCTWSQPCK